MERMDCFLQSFIFLLCSTLLVGRAQAETQHVSLMDLSHKTHLPASTLSAAIADTLWNNTKTFQHVELDVSFSELGNDGMDLVVKSLQRKNSLQTVHLAARMNRLTPEGVSNLLSQVMGVKSSNETEAAAAADKQAATEDTIESNAADEDEETHVYFQSLDLSFNNLSPHQPGFRSFLSNLRRLVEDSSRCPRILRFDQCGLGPSACRALGKGLLKRYESTSSSPPKSLSLSLFLCGNGAIGDSGTAALAAAIRAAVSSAQENQKEEGEEENDGPTVLKVLDLSSCGIGDAGAEALALALEKFPGCIRHLNLSNNRIGNDGVVSLGAALSSARKKGVLESLNLSNNVELGDQGAKSLAEALESGSLRNVCLRSCKVKADGAEAFGVTIKRLATGDKVGQVSIDLSGNPLGVLRGKEKGSGKYSASALKSKASETTASYMSFIGKTIRSGLKDAGLQLNGASVESDDEEEALMGMEDDDNDKSDASKARCGAKAFASAIVIGEHTEEEAESEIKKPENAFVCDLAVRHCFLDRGGADALAAAVLQAKERLGVELKVDGRMNPVLEDEMVEALRGDDPATLEEMTERHMSALEALYIAEQRAKEAVAAAAARARREAAWDEEDEFGLDLGAFGDDGYNDYDEKY